MADTPIDTHAWAVFIHAHTALMERVESRLKAADLPPLAWYDVLWALEQAEEGRLRMNDLAQRMALSRSNLTRLADRLEEQGLIARETCPDDRRGAYCALTAAGKTLRKKMWPTYARAIEETFTRHLSQQDQKTMSTALRRAVDALSQL